MSQLCSEGRWETVRTRETFKAGQICRRTGMLLSIPGEHLMCDRSWGHKVRKVEAELLFTMARKVAPGLGTTGNDGGEENPSWAWPGSTQKKQTCLSQFKTVSLGPRSSQRGSKPFQASGSPCDRAICL